MNADDIEAEAEQILARMTTVRRRARPRLAEALYDAHDESVATPFGPVQAWRLGQGPAVLCVHGWEDDNAIWGPLIDTFAAIGRAVVTFDLPGHGYSEAEEATAESCAAAVAAVAKALGPIEAIAAHSFGCVASAAAMDAGLEVSRAVIIASPLPVAFRRARKWVSEGLFSQAALERAMELQAARAGGTFAGFDVEPAFARMRAPALIVHSLDDEQCPVSNAERIAALWPRNELALVDGLGHRLVAQDGAVLARIVDFIEGA